MLWDLRENLHGMMDITVGRTSGEVPQSRVEMSAGLRDYEEIFKDDSGSVSWMLMSLCNF